MPDDPLLAEADSLGIPWRRLLEAEVAAERELRRAEVEIERESDLPLALCVLSRSALTSWRVRELVGALCGEAAVADSRAPLGRLLRFVRGLAGGAQPDPELVLARRTHCCQAYRRVRELVALLRAAGRIEGPSFSDRSRRLVEIARCSLPDAEWALAAGVTAGTRRLEEAVRRARDEGFQIPLAGSDHAAYRILRGWAATSQPTRPRRAAVPRASRSGRRKPELLHRGDGTLDRNSDS